MNEIGGFSYCSLAIRIQYRVAFASVSSTKRRYVDKLILDFGTVEQLRFAVFDQLDTDREEVSILELPRCNCAVTAYNR